MIQNAQCLASGDYKFPHHTCAVFVQIFSLLGSEKKCSEHFVQRNLTSKREIKKHQDELFIENDQL